MQYGPMERLKLEDLMLVANLRAVSSGPRRIEAMPDDCPVERSEVREHRPPIVASRFAKAHQVPTAERADPVRA